MHGYHTESLLVVLVGEHDAEEHVDHAEDDGQLHLERVEEHDLVLRHLPDRIQSEGVGLPFPSLVVGRGDHVSLHGHDVGGSLKEGENSASLLSLDSYLLIQWFNAAMPKKENPDIDIFS